jgi:REP element-mobilizing transposase RayT
MINSVEDHVHGLFHLSKNQALSKVVEKLKGGSSKWIKSKGVAYAQFNWQNGYAAFSIGRSQLDQTCQYVANQRTHHRKRTFQEELRIFFKKYNVAYDEAYVWD